MSPQGKVITDTYAPMNPNRLGQYIGDNATIPTIDWTKFTNPDQRTGGLGSQVFGPNTSKDHTVPIVMTREASEVGIYIASSGQQAAMIGFMVVDTGDAPESYGNAVHTISVTMLLREHKIHNLTLVENLLILILRQVMIGPMMIVQIMLMKD